MANKKYYWLKLKEDFFEEDTLQWLEEQEQGKEYCLFYLKLCLKSLKSDGVLIRNVGQVLVPYDAKKLSEITRTPTDTVIVAMDLFKKIGLVSILENGEIYMTQLENMVGSETDWARKKRLQRSNEGQCPQLVSEMSDRDRDKEIEIRDRDKEIEIEISISKDILVPKYLVPIQSAWNSLELSQIKSIQGNRLKGLRARVKEHGEATVIEAIENIKTSSFLKGQNNRNWIISFDWLIKPNNFIKVLEGNYSDKEGVSRGHNTSSAGESKKWNYTIPKGPELTDEDRKWAEENML